MPPTRKRAREATITAGSDYRISRAFESGDTSDTTDTTNPTESHDTTASEAADGSHGIEPPYDYDEEISALAFYRESSLESQAPALPLSSDANDPPEAAMDMDDVKLEDPRIRIEVTEPVGSMHWAHTDCALRNLGLCVIVRNNVLSCLLCRESVVMLTLKEAPEHVRWHRGPRSRKPTYPEITKLLKRYEIFEDSSLNNAYTPQHFELPLPYLPVEEVWRCKLCQLKGIVYTRRGGTTASKHFHKEHPGILPKDNEDLVKAQAYSTKQNRRNFIVCPPTGWTPESSIAIEPEFTAEEMTRAFQNEYTPLRAPAPTGGGDLKRTAPFLYFTGFQRFIDGKDDQARQVLLDLVERPKESDTLYELYTQALELFTKYSDSLYDVADCHRKGVMADPTCRSCDKPLERLQEQATRTEYAETLGMFLVFVCRTQRQTAEKKSPLKLHYTPGQIKSIERLWRQSEDIDYMRNWEDLILPCLRRMWRGQDEEDFYYLTVDKWTEPTLVFGLLNCLRPNGKFEPPRECSRYFNRIKYSMRLTLLKWCIIESHNQDRPVGWLRANLAIGLTRNELCPYGGTAEIVSLGERYADDAEANAKVYWIHAGQTVSIGADCTVEIPKWQTGIRDHVMEAIRYCEQEVFFGIPYEQLGLDLDPTHTIYDDHANKTPGYSFMSHPGNRYNELGSALGKRLLTSKEGETLHHGIKDGRVLYDDEAVDIWLRKVTQASNMLLTSTHLVVGQPDRGVEECLMTVCNPPGGRFRSGYIMGPGSFVFIGSYSKTTSMSKKDKPRMHYVPWILARVFIAFHVLACPLAGRLVERESGMTGRYIQETHAFPMRGKEPGAAALSDSIRTIFREKVGAENMGIRNYRQFAATAEETLIPWNKDAKSEMVAMGDVQAGHTAITHQLHYGTEAGKIKVFNSGDYLAFKSASLCYANLILKEGDFTVDELTVITRTRELKDPTYVRTIARPPTARETAVETFKLFKEEGYVAVRRDTLDQMIQDAITKNNAAQHGHLNSKSFSSVGIQANKCPQLLPTVVPTLPIRIAPEAPPSNELDAGHVRRASLSTQHEDAIITVEKDNDPVSDEYTALAPMIRLSTFVPYPVVLPTKQHLNALRTFTKNKNANWTCREQGEAFALATNPGRQSMIIVMATGAGKSLFFMGTLVLEKGITVVIVPLRALLEDQMRSAASKGIPCYEWLNDSEPPFTHGLAFISIERIGSGSGFRRWCLRQSQAKNLVKIVIDEAHTILSSFSFRDAMTYVFTIPERRVPVICLTATLPPALEPTLLAHIGEPTVRIVRAPTQRPNISYNINMYANEPDVEFEVIRHVKLFKDKLAKPGDGLLIICRSVARVQKLVLKFAGATMWHSSEIPEKRAEMSANAARWLSGSVMIMVATSGMGTGINHPNCLAVFHEHACQGAIQYSQESGRTGRGDRQGYAIMFHDGTMFTAPLQRDFTGYDEMKELLNTGECIRQVLSTYLDGPQLHMNCSSGNFVECGNCARLTLASDVAKQYRKTWVRGETCLEELKEVDELMPDPDIGAPTSQAKLDIALSMAPPAAAVHPVVEQDAERSVQRRIQNDLTLVKAAHDGEMNFAYFRTIQTNFDLRCAWCMVHHWETSSSHTLWDCLQAPKHRGKIDIHMDAVLVDGASLTPSLQGPVSVPSGVKICFKCYTFQYTGHKLNGKHAHCTPGGQLRQLLWFSRADDTVWAAMKAYFQLTADLDDPSMMFSWAFTKVEELKWEGHSTVLLNVHRFLMWFFKCYREYVDVAPA